MVPVLAEDSNKPYKMVLIMDFFVDGGCRGNGQPGAIGAAAAVRRYRDGRQSCRTRQLDTYDSYATNQRAEILAIILALEWVMEDYENLNNSPRIEVTIHSDSRYAVNCMNEWLFRWSNNGWTTANGGSVANRDMLQEVIEAENRVLEVGSVVYKWVPRDQVHEADQKCNEVLDDM
jgi:ribonuclease HI